MSGEWISVSVAAQMRGCGESVIRRRAADGCIASRFVPRTDWRGKRLRLEVKQTDALAIVVYPPGAPRGRVTGIAAGEWSGPVTDETWDHFLRVSDLLYARLHRGRRR